MRSWKEEESVPPHWTVSVDDERIVETFAAHTARTERVVRWDEISAWARGAVATWFLDAIVFLTTTTPFYEAWVEGSAAGVDTLLDALERRRLPRTSIEKVREQVASRQRAKVDEVLERRFTAAERSVVRAAFASNPQFSSPYVQLAALNLAGSDVERIRVATRGIAEMREYLYASEQKGFGDL